MTGTLTINGASRVKGVLLVRDDGGGDIIADATRFVVARGFVGGESVTVTGTFIPGVGGLSDQFTLVDIKANP
jgi:hypothetical protein